MSQSLAKIYIHLVFSTKGRTDTNPKANLEEIHAYMAVDGKVDFRQSGFEKGASGRPFQR